MKAREIQQSGFSLVELMVSMSIIGILAGVSVVAFTRNWRDERVKAATKEVAGWLDETRRVAIQQGIPCRITIDHSTATFSLDDDDDTTYCEDDMRTALNIQSSVQNTDSLIVCSSDLNDADPASYVLPCTSATGGNSTVVFTPRGTVTNGLLIKLHMENADTDRCVAVMAPLGQIRSGRSFSSGCDFTTAF